MLIPVFKPKNKLRFAWDLFVVAGIVYTAILLPVQVALKFEQSSVLTFLDILFLAVFVIDVPVNFNTGVFVNNRFEKDRKKIALKYLKGWFFVDFVSAPFYLIVLFFTSVNVGTLLLFKLFRLFKLVRLIKLNHVTRFIQHLLGIDFLDPGYIKLLRFAIAVALVSHLIACFWILLGDVGTDPLTTYTKALYWSITTLSTVGYGDQIPITPPQMVFAMIVMYLGVGLYAFIIGNIATLIANLNMSKVKFRNKMEMINAFLKFKRVPKELQKKINEYYEFVWESQLIENEEVIMRELPKSYKLELAIVLKREFIQKVPLFEGASEELIQELIFSLNTAIYAPDDFVFHHGDDGSDGIFFINSGKVQVLSKDNQVLATMAEGSFFGEMALLDKRKRSASIQCLTYCELLILSSDEFHKVLKKYPKFEKKITAIANQRVKDRGKEK